MAITARPSPAFGRTRPALSLVLVLSFIVGHHWWAVSHHEIYPKLLLFLFMAAGWTLGGIVHPPAFYALTKWGTHLPKSMKVAGAIFGLAGLGLGFYLMLTMYQVTF